MKIVFDDKAFLKDFTNIVEYSVGFLDGAHKGKSVLLDNLGQTAIETLKQFIDSNARVDPAMLAHMYEWYQEGSPDARLFDINYIQVGNGISIRSTFRQSTSIKEGSNVPFYDKARIMENGIPVVIKPVKSSVLVFDDNGNPVFTKKPINVSNPGGDQAENGFESIFNMFFDKYFTQSFMISSGIFSHLQNPVDYKLNLGAGKSGGRSTGLKVGYNWIAKGGKLY